MKRKKAKKKAKPREYVTIETRFPQEAADYLMEVAEIAEVPPSLVLAILTGTAIYHARRLPAAERERTKAVLAELVDARGKLARCREVMEANDPINAREIFGPPAEPAVTPPEPTP